MNINKLFIVLLLNSVISLNLFSQDGLSINFKNLSIINFIKITSKILDKNILLASTIDGNVELMSNNKVYKKDLLNILKHVLESKGYAIIDIGSFFKIIKISDINISQKTNNEVEVVYLKNIEASSVLKIINGMISSKKYKKESKPFVSIDEDSNAIILTGNNKELRSFKKLIEKLDIDKQQVYVQAKIVEISENITKEVGIKYGLNGYSKNGATLSSFSSALNGSSSIDLSSLSTYGFNLSNMKNALSLGMSLNLLHQNGAADIISEPSLLCINNKESSIYVGQTISIKTGTTTTSSGIPTDTYTREDIGLTLKVKPRISNGNKVLLEINTKLEDVEHISLTNTNPDTSKKELITSAIVNNGESIILGGYIKAQKEITTDNVPLLSDIPLLGTLFRNNKEINDKINLVIIITPYIVPKSKDLSYIRSQLSKFKLLEDKYTKDTILRLKKAKLQSKKDDEKRKVATNKKKLTNKELHEQRVKKILGL